MRRIFAIALDSLGSSFDFLRRGPHHHARGRVGFGLVILFAFLAPLTRTRSDTTGASAPTEENPSASATGDDPSDYAAYQRIIVGVGEPCDRVKRTFIAGTDKRTNTTFVSVGCVDGHDYQVSGRPDRGSTRVLSCSMLYAVAKVRCFERLETQR